MLGLNQLMKFLHADLQYIIKHNVIIGFNAHRLLYSPELIQARLKRAVEEAVGIEAYDYIVLNDVLEVCVEELHQLIQAQHNRTSNRLEFLNEIRKGLEIL